MAKSLLKHEMLPNDLSNEILSKDALILNYA
jgi:hypothetical protein